MNLKKITLAFCLAILALPLVAADFYVSPRGSDAADGSAQHPFATPEGARDAARAVRAAVPAGQPMTVWLAGGDYSLTNAFTLTPEDSGTT